MKRKSKPISLTKPWHYVLFIGATGFLLLGIALSSLICMFVIYKPFDAFVHAEIEARYGENIFPIDDRKYVWGYEVDGIEYEKQGNLGGGKKRWPTKFEFDYLASDPEYALFNRNLMLTALPIVCAVCAAVYAVILKSSISQIKRVKRNQNCLRLPWSDENSKNNIEG